MSTAKIAIRTDTAANWTSADPVLEAGEQGHESDTGNRKIGDGATAWTSLNYIGDQPGDIKAHAAATAPFGWLSADGSAVSRTSYASLFDAIGTTWGAGDGSTTFNVPDLRGAFVRGAGSHGSETMANGGAFAGPAVGAFEDDQMQGHWHDEMTSPDLENANASSARVSYRSSRTSNNDNIGYSPGTLFTTTSDPIRDPRSDGTNGTPRTGDESRPFAAGVLYCVKI